MSANKTKSQAVIVWTDRDPIPVWHEGILETPLYQEKEDSTMEPWVLMPAAEYRRLKRENKLLLSLSAKFTPQWVFDEYEAHLKAQLIIPINSKAKKARGK